MEGRWSYQWFQGIGSPRRVGSEMPQTALACCGTCWTGEWALQNWLSAMDTWASGEPCATSIAVSASSDLRQSRFAGRCWNHKILNVLDKLPRKPVPTQSGVVALPDSLRADPGGG